MIIVSQDKMRILNFEQLQEIEINTPEDWRQGFYSIDTYPLGEGDETHIRLGKYSTEERAKEILDKIMIARSDFKYYKNAPEKEREQISELMKAKYLYFDTYEMPEE